MTERIHLFGASGSGTTTLGAALADHLGLLRLDCDDFYWKDTDPPFTIKNPPSERVAMIREAIGEQQGWVLSGSLCSWGDILTADFTLAVFLYLDPEIRLQRLRQRERQRYGERIEPGGDMHGIHADFMQWAASYETARAPTRSLHLHWQWRQTLRCPVIDLNSAAPPDELVEQVLRATGNG